MSRQKNRVRGIIDEREKAGDERIAKEGRERNVEHLSTSKQKKQDGARRRKKEQRKEQSIADLPDQWDVRRC